VKKIEVTNGDLTNDGGRVVSINTAGTDTTPGGSNTDVQINDGGSFGGASTLTFASSTLSVENAIDVGSIGAGGRVECTQDGQDLQIKHTGTGKVEVVNATNDTDTDLQITGPGTGAANLTLSGPSGGVTFTDGTTQTTAASAALFTVGPQPTNGWYSGRADWTQLALSAPWRSTTSVNPRSFSDDRAQFYPFYSEVSGTLLTGGIYVSSGAGSTQITCGIYDTDANGNPGALLCTQDFDSSSTATVTSTTFSPSAPTLVRGTMYWYAVVRSSGTNSPQIYAANRTYQCAWGLADGPSTLGGTVMIDYGPGGVASGTLEDPAPLTQMRAGDEAVGFYAVSTVV
jgi:hypothetical protein